MHPQSIDCSLFYKGEFHYILDGIETKAIRKTEYQVIFRKVKGDFIKDSIESILWLDSCTFKVKIIESNFPVSKIIQSSGLVFKIISIQGNSYIYQAYLDRRPYYSGKVTKVKD